MNRAVIFLIASFLIVLFIPNVTASPAEKIPVTAQTYNQVNSGSGEMWTTNGSIVHVQNAVRTGDVWLKIGDEPTIYGTLWEEVSYMANTKTGMVVVHNHKTVWTFEDGCFEGVKINKQETAGPTVLLAMEQHAVLQGSEDFDGQTLMISMDWEQGDSGPRIYTGFIVIP